MIDSATAADPLVMVEVTPLIVTKTRANGTETREGGNDKLSFLLTYPSISNPSAKLQLINMCRQGLLSPGWLGTGVSTHANHEKNTRNTRCLRLKVKLPQSASCDFCLGRVQLAEPGTIRKGEPNHHNSYQTIVSGDLRFQRKDEIVDKKGNESVRAPSIFVTYIQSGDPLDELGVPCQLRGYIFTSKRRCYCQTQDRLCMMTWDTAVYICPPLEVSHEFGTYTRRSIRATPDELLCSVQRGTHDLIEARVSAHFPLSDSLQNDADNLSQIESIPKYSKLSCYNMETVQSLSLRMSSMLANSTWIGTTQHALLKRNKSLQMYDSMKMELDAFWGPKNTDVYQMPTTRVVKNSTVPLLLREGAILVHNSHPNSGKSTLVEAIATDLLKCDAVHKISAPALIAKYGISADAAFESILHELALRCAVKGRSSQPEQQSAEPPKLCIILDHFESFLPVSSQSAGDPYLPVLNGMIAHLNRLSISLKTKNEFPFPLNNPLYNVCASEKPSIGFTLPLGICLIGVMTCAESNGKKSMFQSALDAIGGGRFRVPLPSATTRLTAFLHAFEICGLKLTNDAAMALPGICAKVNRASGGAFLNVARKLKSEMTRKGSLRAATEHDLKQAIMRGLNLSNDRTISIAKDYPSFNSDSVKSKAITFSSVGGNVEAKLALEDALALDPAKQHLLSKFGLKLPMGVLLYGPPGTGKTLLARAVAQLLFRKDTMGIGNNGGTFISLNASDIVRPEVGGSEKLIVSAFETARQNAPSVLFIDEFQSLFGDREGEGFILGQLSSTLLQCMDDITRWSEADPQHEDDESKSAIKQNRRVVVLGATNAPWMIDKAFLRPGRFDRAVHVGLPNAQDREDILRVHVSNMKLAPQTDGLSPLDEISKSMAHASIGYSGADLAALCRAAVVRYLSNGDGANGISKQHFTDAVHDVMRSSNDKLLKKISAWKPNS